MDSHYRYKIGNIGVVYEDDWFLIADKPVGLLTIPTPKNESRTLTSILNADLKKRGITYRLHPCHRLDRETSGLIIYAKGKASQKKMMQTFKQGKVRKEYIAFLQGRLESNRGLIKNPIEGKTAQTEYAVLEKRSGFSVVKVYPLTGRTNQIRIHFKKVGHPVLGETKFAFRRDFKIKARRLCLHARHLEFIHPVNNERIYLDINLPEDLEEFLRTH